jgi:hypothetical protein
MSLAADLRLAKFKLTHYRIVGGGSVWLFRTVKSARHVNSDRRSRKPPNLGPRETPATRTPIAKGSPAGLAPIRVRQPRWAELDPGNAAALELQPRTRSGSLRV